MSTIEITTTPADVEQVTADTVVEVPVTVTTADEETVGLAVCGPNEAHAEDGSCVPMSYWGEESVPVIVDEAPVEGRTDTVYVPETGQIVQEDTGEVIDQLAVTGIEDLSPLTVILGAALLVAGIAARVRGARAGRA
jgi:hypothetical protein